MLTNLNIFLISIFDLSPLNSSLILTSSWKQKFGIIWKFDMSNMFWMTSIFIWFMAIEQWISIKTNKSIVISRGNQLLIFWHTHWVNMRPITTCWEYSLHIPSKFTWLITPDSFYSIWRSTCISFLFLNIEEKKFICSTYRSNVFRIDWPIKACYEWAMACKFCLLLISFSVNNIYVVVVRTNS